MLHHLEIVFRTQIIYNLAEIDKNFHIDIYDPLINNSINSIELLKRKIKNTKNKKPLKKLKKTLFFKNKELKKFIMRTIVLLHIN